MYTVTEYAVTIKKGPRGVGLGLVVAQDPKSGSIAVTKVRACGCIRPVLPCETFHTLSCGSSEHWQVTDGIKIIIAPGEAKPHIFLQDVLVGIGDDRIVGWPIARGGVLAHTLARTHMHSPVCTHPHDRSHSHAHARTCATTRSHRPTERLPSPGGWDGEAYVFAQGQDGRQRRYRPGRARDPD
jgi:hypothetical protein